MSSDNINYIINTFGSLGNIDKPGMISPRNFTNFNGFSNINSVSSMNNTTNNAGKSNLNESSNINSSYQTQQPTHQQQIHSQQKPPSHKISAATLSTAISSLTYGLSSLIYLSQTHQIYQALIMIHQAYINIIHIIINRSISYLLKLHDIKSIQSQDTFISNKLATLVPQLRDNFIVLNLKSLKTVVLVFKTQTQKQIILLGLKFFLNQGKQFYSKLSQYDPFRAQSMILFLEADKDGGNLLDIEEIINILNQLKINKQKLDIQSDVLQINKSLYQRENMKKSKNATSQQLTPIGFQYLLRYYSTKQQLIKYFKQYCPMFKPKTKNHKNTIIDCIRNNQKPIMSSVQLRDFYQAVLNQKKTIEQLNQLIIRYPLYDGQGKEKLDYGTEEPLLNFDNFCNLVCSRQNSLIDLNNPKYKLIQHDEDQINYSSQTNNQGKLYLGYSLLDYYIYTDLSVKNIKRKEKVNFYNLALKRGVKCINLVVNISMSHFNKGASSTNNKSNTTNNNINKLNSLVVKIGDKQNQQFFIDDILKDVKIYAFQKNPLPFFIVFDLYQLFKLNNHQQYMNLLADIIDENFQKQMLFVHHQSKYSKKNVLPSPLQLSGKIVLLTNFNPKMVQKISNNKNQNYQIPINLAKKLSFSAVKLDFQRKGQSCWNSCFVQQDILKSCQSAQQQNISNYAKKLLLFYVRKPDAQPSTQVFSCFRQGVHFVGQDFERNKQASYIVHSKFSEVPDQAFGYLLKPQYMHTENSAPLYTNKNFTKALPTRIKFNILSGQKIILNQIEYKQFHIEVFIKGSTADQQNNKIYKSQRRTQGFYAQINLECEFVVYNQQMLAIVIIVKNSQNGKILGGRSVSLTRMKQGLRTLQLLNDRMQSKENSYLLIYYTRKQMLNKDDRTNRMQEFLK